MSATRCHSVTPPHSVQSRLRMETPPLVMRSRQARPLISPWPTLIGMVVLWASSIRPSVWSYHLTGSSIQRTPRSARSMATQNFTASSGSQPWLASTVMTKSAPPALRAARTRSRSSSRLARPTFILMPMQPAARTMSTSSAMASSGSWPFLG